MIVVVNLDPARPQEGLCVVPVQLGFPPAFHVEDLLTGELHPWRAGRNYIALPAGTSHVMKVQHRV